MPEYPDITVYIEAIGTRALGQTLLQLRLNSPFLVRTVQPPVSSLHGQQLTKLLRIGKRIAFGFSGGQWLVLHLMVAGRLHWKPAGAAIKGKLHLAAFDFASGTLTLTEAGSKRQAAVHLFPEESSLNQINPGGLEVYDADFEQFSTRLTAVNHTLKRALTDPHILSGIGNAYSDEILWSAQLSPVALTQKLTTEEVARLFHAIRERMTFFTDVLRAQCAGAFPENVTAFRPEMAMHGKFGKPCPRCSTPVQRIVFASNETNYCPTCQTAGKLLADRALSRLLGKDWPKSLDELETIKAIASRKK